MWPDMVINLLTTHQRSYILGKNIERDICSKYWAKVYVFLVHFLFCSYCYITPKQSKWHQYVGIAYTLAYITGYNISTLRQWINILYWCQTVYRVKWFFWDKNHKNVKFENDIPAFIGLNNKQISCYNVFFVEPAYSPSFCCAWSVSVIFGGWEGGVSGLGIPESILDFTLFFFLSRRPIIAAFFPGSSNAPLASTSTIRNSPASLNGLDTSSRIFSSS